MAEQRTGIESSPSMAVPWWVRLCRWLWRVLLFVWGTLVVNILVGTLANLNTTTTDTPLSRLYLVHLAITYPLLVSTGIATLLVLTLLTWLGNRAMQGARIRPLSKHDRIHMLHRLHAGYEQLLAQSLQGVVQMELRLVSRPATVQNTLSLSLRLPDQPEQVLPAGTSMSYVYEQAHQELLILGEPGAGKSTLLLELACHLVKQAEQDENQLFPVLLPLSTFATSKLSFHQWLCEQVTRLYNIPQSLSQHLLETEQLLLLLDGLDEMHASATASCITAINTYHRNHLRPLVVCSRTSEYITAANHEHLSLHTAVVVQPLSHEQVDSYLANSGEPLAALRAALQENPSLQEVATTPLMINILMLTYSEMPVRLASRKQEALMQQVWTDYVERMVQRKGNARRYPLSYTTRRLSWLAKAMQTHNQTIFSLGIVRLRWIPQEYHSFYWVSVALVSGLVAGLIGWLVTRLVGGSIAGLAGGLVAGVVDGLAVGFTFEPFLTFLWMFAFLGLCIVMIINPIIWLARQTGLADKLSHVWKTKNLSHVWEKMRDDLIASLIGGLIGGVVAGLAGRLIIGLIIGPIIGLVIELARRMGHDEKRSQSLKKARVGQVIVVLMGLTIGVTVGMATGLLIGPIIGLLMRLVIEGVIGLIIGLFIGLTFAIAYMPPVVEYPSTLQHYLLRVLLWRLHLFPFRVAPFLEDATARTLLKREGGGYSFTHRLLLDYFADLDPTIPPIPAMPSRESPIRFNSLG